MAKLPQGPMTVVGLVVDSYKRMHAARVTPTADGIILVRGENEQGKSSLIDAMTGALLGKKGVRDEPINRDAHGAEVIIDLGEIVVEKRWTRDAGGKAKAALVVRDADGRDHKSPQAILDALVGHFADPLTFLALKPDEQVKTVLRVMELDEALEELESKARMQFDERRDLGRDADRITKTATELGGEIEGIPPPPSEGSVEELARKLQHAKDHNAAIATLEQKRTAAEERGHEVTRRIEELERELTQARSLQESIAAQWKDANKALKGLKQIDTEPIVEKLRAHEEASKFAGKRERYEQALHEAEEARAAHSEVNEALAATREEINDLLAAAEFPVEGMAYDQDRKLLTVNGVPLSEASQSQRLKIGARIAMAGDPPIRVMFAREGAFLDEKGRAELAKIVEEHGWQLWLEVVDSKREGTGIWIEDGVAYQTESEAAE